MPRRVTILALAAALGACSAGPDSTTSADSQPTTSEQPKVFAEGEWELRISYRGFGTRSEGQDGVLFLRGREVTGATVGEVRDTSLGRLRFYGPPVAGAPWTPSGWNFADASKIRRSWELPDRR